ncbi:hypothetical protein [Maridesulfovibrio sp.]|uniref:hypothetical protein n=1 Tax=Maridesulfovibrio sp. TaxID=2795000 RepID=UPI003BAA4D77
MDIVQIIEIAAEVVGVCATIAAITPSPKDDAIVKPLVKLVNVLGMNLRHARNAGDK